MKVNKYLFKAFAATMALVGLASCSSDDYDMVSAPNTKQVYFSNNVSSEILIEENQNKVEIEVLRCNTKGDLTVELGVVDTTAANLFTIPSTVTFADGDSVAIVPVTFSFASLAADHPYAIGLELKDQTTPYGDASKQFIIKYAPWSEWEPFGWQYPSNIESLASGRFAAWVAAYQQYAAGDYSDPSLIADGDIPTYTYTQYLSGEYSQPVFVRSSMLNPTLRQIMLPDWAYGVDLVLDWKYVENEATGDVEENDITIAEQSMGYFHTTYGDFVKVTDTYNAFFNLRGDASYTKEDHLSYYDSETGRFNLDITYGIWVSGRFGVFGNGIETIQLPGYVQKDYALDIYDKGAFLNEKEKELGEIFNFVLGTDLSKIQYAAFEGELTDEEVADKAEAMFSGDIESVTTTESGRKVVLVAKEGIYTLVVITYDEEGNRLETMSQAFEVKSPSPAKTWTALYTGDFVYYGLFGNEDGSGYTDAGLTLLRCDQDPTLFKIEHWGYDVDFTFSMDEEGNVIVDDQPTGVDGYSVIDITGYTGTTKYGTSYYDSESGTFYFNVVYYLDSDPSKYLWPDPETFTITGQAAKAALSKAVSAAKLNTVSKHAGKTNRKFAKGALSSSTKATPKYQSRLVMENKVVR